MDDKAQRLQERERERVVLSLFGMMYSIPLDVDTKKRTKKRPFEEGNKTSLFFFFKFDTLNLSLCSLSVLFCLFFIFFLSSKIVFETTRPKTRNSAFLFSFRPFLFRETTRSRERERETHAQREREEKTVYIYIYRSFEDTDRTLGLFEGRRRGDDF